MKPPIIRVAPCGISAIASAMAMAFFFIPLQAILFSGLPPERMPSAAGMSNFVRITAGAMGTSITTTLWESRAQMHHAHLAETLDMLDSMLKATLTRT